MRASRLAVGALAALTLAGCQQVRRSQPALDSVSGFDAENDTLLTGEHRSIDIVLPESPHPVSPSPAASSDRDREPGAITLPRGVALAVHLDRSLSTTRSRAGQAFHAVLDAPLVVNGRRVLPRGTRFSGHVTTSESAGHLRGRAELAITLDGVDVDGRRYPIATSVTTRLGASHTRRNLTFIGGGGGLGALVGGWTGGKKGVAIGTAVGAGAGTAAAASTGKAELEMPAKQLYRFSLAKSVRLPG